MNQTELNKVMNFYIRHYDEIRRREHYKWEAAAAWQASAPMKASSFPEALRAGLKKAGNLLDSGYYYPKTALFMMLSRDPEAVEYMFEDLFCEKDEHMHETDDSSIMTFFIHVVHYFYHLFSNFRYTLNHR